MLPGDVEEGEAKGGGQGEVAEETESNVHFLAGCARYDGDFQEGYNVRAYLRDMRMRNGRKVRMKSRKLATDPEVAFFMMTERRKVNMMMETP